MRLQIVAANWKMNGSKTATDKFLAYYNEKIPRDTRASCVIFAPFVYLSIAEAHNKERKFHLGSQDVSSETFGAYTGEIAAEMLEDVGCGYVLVGHSERRQYFAESDALIYKKSLRAIDTNLIPMLCIGETLKERQAGETQAVLAKQLAYLLEDKALLSSGLVIAYEPVWAIGTGKAASLAEIEATHAYIRQIIAGKHPTIAEKISILYGGSVNRSNAKEIFSLENVDGGLVGGASLDVEHFLEIITCIK